MKIDLDETTQLVLFQALRAYIRQLAIKNSTASQEESLKLQELWKAARAAEVLYVAAILEAKEQEEKAK